MLLADDEALGHRLAAEWLEAKGEQDPIVLGEHFELGGLTERAAESWQHATARASWAADHATAIKYAKRGLALTKEPQQRCRLLELVSQAYIFSNQWTEGAAIAEEMMTLAKPGSAAWARAILVQLMSAQAGVVTPYVAHPMETLEMLLRVDPDPAGLSSMETRLREITLSVQAGAREIDIVISRRHVLMRNWSALYVEMQAFRAACGDAHVKAILATGELQTLDNVARASWVCMMAGADFIKTSTGKEGVNATPEVSLVMVRAIRDYLALSGCKVGYKPAGGISSAKAALQYLTLMKEELGEAWLQPSLFRFGASSLLTDIERQLEHYVTGRYSATHRHAMP